MTPNPLLGSLYLRCIGALAGCLLLPIFLFAQKPAAPAKDPLGRENPRSAVTNFLEACHSDDYVKAAQYLDLTRIPARSRAQQGPVLAKDLEAVLNSDSSFDVLRLSLQAQGNPKDPTNPTRERVATINEHGKLSHRSGASRSAAAVALGVRS